MNLLARWGYNPKRHKNINPRKKKSKRSQRRRRLKRQRLANRAVREE